MPFKIIRKNCCGLDVHKTWIYACIGITDPNGRTEYFEKRFSSFSNGLRNLSEWLSNHNCSQVCMESTGKYWIPVFNVLEKTCAVELAHPKYTKPQKGNKTDRKDARRIFATIRSQKHIIMIEKAYEQLDPRTDTDNEILSFEFSLENLDKIREDADFVQSQLSVGKKDPA